MSNDPPEIHQATTPPRPGSVKTGLYDPAFEHDACGVAFVARLDAVPSHETVERALTALANLEHRGAAGADADTGDGAGILVQMPDAFFRANRRRAAAGRRVRRRRLLPAARRRCAAPSSSALVERTVADEGQRVLGVAGRPGRRRAASATRRAGVAPVHPPGRRRRADGPRARTRSSGSSTSSAAWPSSRPGRARHPELLVAHARLQGDAHRAAARAASTPISRDDRLRERARARPLALLDEHVPELGARPPVPDDRAQRRDQHAARQRQLDARARVAARVGALRRRPAEGAAGHPARRLRHRDVRQRARAARARRPLAAARADDDDPRGVRGPRRRSRRAARLLRVPPVPDGGVGRAGGDLRSRTGA